MDEADDRAYMAKREQEMVGELVWKDHQAGPRGRDQVAAPFSGDESTLIEAAQSGNLPAFNQLVLDHQDAVFGWVVSLVRDEAAAADITQLTFVTAYQKIHTFRGGSLKAWLFRIARNRSIDHLRLQQRRFTLSLDDDARDGDSPELLSILAADGPLPEEAVVQAEQAAHLRRLLGLLPEPFRQVLQLVDMDALDYQEAAAVLNVPLGTVKSRLVRARLKLRELVMQNGGLRESA